MSSEFDKARQEIERIKEQTKIDRSAREAEAKAEVERQNLLRICEEQNKRSVGGVVSGLLSQANREIFGGKGTVIGWHRVKTGRHFHSEMYEVSDFSVGYRDVGHNSVQFESRLIVPNFGDIVVLLPVKEWKEGYAWKRVDNPDLQIGVTPENNSVVCGGPSVIGFKLSPEEFSKEVGSSIATSVVNLHKLVLTKKI